MYEQNVHTKVMHLKQVQILAYKRDGDMVRKRIKSFLVSVCVNGGPNLTGCSLKGESLIVITKFAKNKVNKREKSSHATEMHN